MRHTMKETIYPMSLDQIVAGDEVWRSQDGAFYKVGIVKEKQHQGTGFAIVLDTGEAIRGCRYHSEWVRPRTATLDKIIV